MELKVGTVGLQASRDNVSVREAGVVTDDDVRKWCDDRWTPLEPGELTLLIRGGGAPRLLRRARRRRETHGTCALEDDEGTPEVVRLGEDVENIELVICRWRRTGRRVRAPLVDDVDRRRGL